jgi:hypothetical protein
MKKLSRIIVGILCMVMLVGSVTSCITLQTPAITAEERVLVEKILARRVGYEIAKRHEWMSGGLESASNHAIALLKGTSADEEISKAIDEFILKLTDEYLTNDPMLRQDVLDLSEIIMPTIKVEDELGDYILIDENLKSELIAIFTAFNTGIRIAYEENAR